MAVMVINKNPRKKDLLVFGIGLPILAGIIGWHRWANGSETLAQIIWAVGGVLALVFAVVPPARKPIYIGWMHVVFPIGWVVSHVILGAVYFLVFAPVALIMKAVGKDPMNRRFDKEAKSYWIVRDAVRDKASYFRQS